MEEIGRAGMAIVPTFDNFDQRHLDAGTSKAMLAAGTRGGTRFGDAAGRSAGQRFASVFGTVAKAGLVGALTGGALLGAAGYKLGKNSIAEAREAQKVGALTTAVIKSTGGAANVTAKYVGGLSEALSNKTGVDDEVIQRGANLMLTFKGVRNEVGKNNDIFTQSVAITEDMAAALAGGKGGGLDLKSSSILVGKALNDPIKGLTALSRAGVQFTEGQREQIEALVESGDKMAAQKIILSELKSEFGGAAEAQATMGDKVSVAWSNIQEKLGKVLLPMLDDVQRAFLKKGVPALEHWVDVFQDKGVPALKDFYEKAKPVAEDALPKIGDALGTVKDVLAEAAPLALDLVEAFNDMPSWAKKALVGGGLALGVGNKLGMGGLLGGRGGMGGLISKASPMPVFVTNPGFGGVGGPGGKTPPVGVVPGTGKIPGFVVPVGVSSAPGQQSLYDTITGKKQGSMPGALPMPKGAFSGSQVEQYTGPSPSDADIANFMDYRNELERTAEAAKKLPREVRTHIALHGAPETRREVKEIVEQYDLMPREKRTLIETSGIPNAKGTIRDYKDVLGGVPEKESTTFNIYGVSGALTALDRAQAKLEALDGRTYRAIMELHTVRTGAGGQGAGYGGLADGGTVGGSRWPYGDKVLTPTAPGEEVISNRYGQADRFRPVLKAINANRGLADGGTVAGARAMSQPISLAGLRIEGRIELTHDGAYLRGVIAEEIRADRKFEQKKAGR